MTLVESSDGKVYLPNFSFTMTTCSSFTIFSLLVLSLLVLWHSMHILLH